MSPKPTPDLGHTGSTLPGCATQQRFAVADKLGIGPAQGAGIALLARPSEGEKLLKRACPRSLQGQRLDFGFPEFLPIGLLGFGVILSIAVVRTLGALD